MRHARKLCCGYRRKGHNTCEELRHVQAEKKQDSSCPNRPKTAASPGQLGLGFGKDRPSRLQAGAKSQAPGTALPPPPSLNSSTDCTALHKQPRSVLRAQRITPLNAATLLAHFHRPNKSHAPRLQHGIVFSPRRQTALGRPSPHQGKRLHTPGARHTPPAWAPAGRCVIT
jgi:hypothetical protein